MQRTTAALLKEQLPILITSDGEPIAVLSDPNKIIAIDDMSIIQQRRMKALEAIIRLGMPKPEKAKMVIPEEDKYTAVGVKDISQPVKGE